MDLRCENGRVKIGYADEEGDEGAGGSRGRRGGVRRNRSDGSESGVGTESRRMGSR